jgi:hypothetical protein
VVYPDFLSPTPSWLKAMKPQKIEKRALITLNQQIKEISKWNAPEQLYSPSVGAVTKN